MLPPWEWKFVSETALLGNFGTLSEQWCPGCQLSFTASLSAGASVTAQTRRWLAQSLRKGWGSHKHLTKIRLMPGDSLVPRSQLPLVCAD